MRDRDALVSSLQNLCMVRAVDVLPRGHIRLETGFLYPDGASVDVFIVNDSKAPLLPPTRLSDLGQTMAFLLNHDVKPWITKKRRDQLADAIALYGVEHHGGELRRPLSNTDKATIQEGVILLGQACLRMSDLIFTKRLQLQSDFSEDVEELLTDNSLDYERSAKLPGKFALVDVDFLVRGQKTTSAVLTLSSRIASAAHTQANEVFRKMYDLQAADRSEQRVTLFDDRILPYRDEDLRRIEQHSMLVPFSDPAAALALLAA